jgi:uncharacterized membrane protein YesL
MAPRNQKDSRQSFGHNAEEWRLATLVHSAIAGVSLAAIVELANSQALSTWLLAASVLFALALPASVSSVVLLQYFQAHNQSQYVEAMMKHPLWSSISSLLALMAQVACFGGVLLLFWHLHWIAGVTFISTSLIAVLTLVTLGRKSSPNSVR